MYAPRIVATNKKGAKALPLPVPERVQWIWDEIKHKTMRQLFDPIPKKRLEAIAALVEKYTVYDKRQSLLIAAVFDEPDAVVRLALLEAIASLHGYAGWQDIACLREGAGRFIDDPDAAVRFALARCFVALPVALVEGDLAWLAALAPLVTREQEFDLVATLVVRAVEADVARPRAVSLLGQLARHQSFGRRALWSAAPLLRESEIKELLLELVENVCDASVRAALDTAIAFENSADPRAISALEAHRARLDGHQWHTDLAIGVVDPSRLDALLARYDAEVRDALRHNATDTIVLDALSWAPEHAAKHADVCAIPVVVLSSVRRESALRWIRGNRAKMAQVLAPQLSSAHGAKILEYWEHLAPESAAEDAAAVIAHALEAHPRGAFPYEAYVRCDACCALFARVGRLPSGAMPLLSRVCARLAPQLVNTALSTVRTMHAFGATDEDFALMVDAFEKDARANDERASSDPAFDPATSWGAKLRTTAIALRSLRDIATVRARWDAFTFLWNREFYLDQQWVLMMLAPYVNEPDVRALFEEGLRRRSGEVQREAARALGLLWSAA